jgi:hypothetical protein
MAEISRRDSAVGHGDNVKPVYAAFGDPETGKMRINAPGASDNIQPAGVFSTAAHTKPKLENLPNGKLCNWEEKPCRGYATRTGYCVGHSKSLGLF